MWIYRGRNGFGRRQEGRNIQLGFTTSSISEGNLYLYSMCTSVLFYIDYFMLLKVAIAFLEVFIFRRERDRETAREHMLGESRGKGRSTTPLSSFPKEESDPRLMDLGLRRKFFFIHQ